MLTTRLYYTVKPYLPWRLRITMRRISARRTLAASRNTWPIQAAAAQPPSDWTGWPDGKRFALVLTHDVESATGLAKCPDLLAFEQQFGVRSSYNFVPEGTYSVSPEFRAQIAAQGFEVGVHDLKHDGKLFHSRRGFQRRAQRINRYARDWDVAGFRAGFMLRNLDWLHDLDIKYDSSTFDTDPFELQSDGAGTIFPFWIPTPSHLNGTAQNGDLPVPSGTTARDRGGYVELPYTLPQDSTLFLVLRETSPDIWLRKLDWVADHGGMAMVNVHPDYIAFRGSPGHQEYPVDHYGALLRHARQKYAGQFWNATPRQVAAWFLESRVRSPEVVRSAVTDHAVASPTAGSNSSALRGKKAAVLLYSHYPSDPRPRRAAETMVDAGMSVDLLCLADSSQDALNEVVQGVNVSRIQLKHRRDSKLTYLWQYSRFFLSSFWFLTRNGIRRRYDVVHVHNMPDFLVFAAIVPKLRGAAIILDLHDPMPELMMSIYRLQANDWRVKLLRRLEQWSIAFAKLVLTPNKSFKDLFVSRGCAPEKMQIVMNSPEETIFDPDRFKADAVPVKPNGEFRVMHHGSILHRHGVDLLVAAMVQVREAIPGAHLDIYGFRDRFLDTVLDVARGLGVDDIVHYHGPKSQQEIADAIRTCDVGVVPNRQTPFTAINFPTRLFEYLSMHRPVIAPATKGIQDYFGAGEIITFKSEDVSDLADKIIWVYRNPAAARELVQRGVEVYRQHLWSNEKRRLTNLIGAAAHAV